MIVVPANAGTHNHRLSRLWRSCCYSLLRKLNRWLWVPARAEPVIGLAFARPVGLAGTTWILLERLAPAKRIIPLVFPVAALVVVGDLHRDHVFRILESEFCGHPDLHRIAIGAGQDFVAESERHLGLRMQRRRHVERAVVAFQIRALEPAIFRACVGPDYFEEVAQRSAGPASDRAP